MKTFIPIVIALITTQTALAAASGSAHSSKETAASDSAYSREEKEEFFRRKNYSYAPVPVFDSRIDLIFDPRSKTMKITSLDEASSAHKTYLAKISDEIGSGVFAAEDIKEGETICLYSGRILFSYDRVKFHSPPMFFIFDPSKTHEELLLFNYSDDPMLFKLDHKDIENTFLLADAHPRVADCKYVTCGLIIDPSEFRNEGVMVNCSPRFANARVSTEYLSLNVDGEDKITIAAVIRACCLIKKGEQILWDYGMDFSTTWGKAKLLDLSPRDNSCYVCKKAATSRCAKCKIASYCGREHQRDDWSEHKKFCHQR